MSTNKPTPPWKDIPFDSSAALAVAAQIAATISPAQVGRRKLVMQIAY